MFTFSLVAAALQLAAACACFASRWVKSGIAAFLLCGCLSFLFMSPLLLLQFLALLVTGLVCWAFRPQLRYLPVAAALLTAAIFIAFGLEGTRGWSQLQDRYPIVSLADRLAYETEHRAPTNALSVGTTGLADHDKFCDGLATAALAELDKLYEKSDLQFWERRRFHALSLVHASYVTQFVNSPGFGVARGIPDGPDILDSTYNSIIGRMQGPVPMPDAEPPPEASAQDASSNPGGPAPREATTAVVPQLKSIHREAQLDFANVGGFGYVQDRDHVVGFESHRFSKMPSEDEGPPASHKNEPGQPWDTRRVELVSLLKHPQPMVYLSKNLPRMDDLRKAPVRPLDAFEEESLAALRAGAEVQTRDLGDRIRMLGAVRGAKQCLSCHEVEHGALLGAFSYEFRLRPPTAAQSSSGGPAYDLQ